MSDDSTGKNRKKREHGKLADEIFDFSGSEPDALSSGRIPDPQPEHTALFRWLADVLGGVEEFLRARGGVNLRMSIRVFWGLLAAIGVFLLFGPIINGPMSIDEVIAKSKIADVDWIAQDASFDYEVMREADGSFATTVHESYTANFVNGPERTVVRRIVTEVHGHDAEFELVSATIDGAPADVTETGKATVTDVTLRPTDGGKFAGKHEIDVTYELHHLIENSEDQVTGAPVDEWAWPVFAPSWTQATSGLEVSVTLPRDIDDELVRKPYATVGWLLVSGNVWLEPDEETPDWVRYSFTNDDNLPPNSDVWIQFVFSDGTFAQPPQTTLFWVQTWGPLIPLAALAIIMLFALAARWIVWADSVGEPWFLVRSDPPQDLSPELAAQLLGKPRHAELVHALAEVAPAATAASNVTESRGKRWGRRRKIRGDDGARDRQARAKWLQTLAEVGRRAGRVGNLPSAANWVARWSKADTPVGEKLRWVPNSYVRDTFIWAPIALTLVQWGILRQLSEQLILLVVWWPFAFVAASTIIAAIAIWAVSHPRPLTRKGALAVQQLKGIDVYARGTRLLDRGPVDDPLLPYSVLFERPRTAGNAVTEHAIRETGDRNLARRWRSDHFLSIPAMLAFVVSIALLAGSIVLAAILPTPYGEDEFLTWPSSETKGAIWAQVEGFSIEAELTRDDSGAARLDVVEHLDVGFEAGGSSVPQLEREWTASRLGQDLGLKVSSVRIDDADVPFDGRYGDRTAAMATRLTDIVEGKHEVEVRYSLSTPAVEAANGGDTMQQVRWAAMLHFWEDMFYTNQSNPFDGSAPVRPLRLQLTIAPDLVDHMKSGGWIAYGDSKREPYESGTGIKPWVYENEIYVDGPSGNLDDSVRHDLRVGQESVRADGALVVLIDADGVESRVSEQGYGDDLVPAGMWGIDPQLNDTFEQYELGLTSDPGATLNFANGTFTNVTSGSLGDYKIRNQLALVGLILFTVFVAIAAVIICLYLLRAKRRIGYSLLLTSAGTMTLLALAETVGFWWITGTMPGDSAAVPGLFTMGLVMWALVVAQWIFVGISGPRSSRRQLRKAMVASPSET